MNINKIFIFFKKSLPFEKCIFLCFVLLAHGVFGCAAKFSPKKTPQEQVVTKTHYDIRKESPLIQPLPLPSLIPIWVDWHFSDNTSESNLMFRGWDFDGDEKIDMLEILNEKGNVVAVAFDFTNDGNIDLFKEIKSK